jgi:hypothetical protein
MAYFIPKLHAIALPWDLPTIDEPGNATYAKRYTFASYHDEQKSNSLHPHPNPPPSRVREEKEGITFMPGFIIRS